MPFCYKEVYFNLLLRKLNFREIVELFSVNYVLLELANNFIVIASRRQITSHVTSKDYDLGKPWQSKKNDKKNVLKHNYLSTYKWNNWVRIRNECKNNLIYICLK